MIPRFAVVIGAMKSGTTSLFNYLAEHPEVAGADPKEPQFFSEDHLLAGGRERYEAFFGWDPAVHRVALEASVNYTKLPRFPNVAERIAAYRDAHGAGFKLIYIMRDPVDRIVSHLNHHYGGGWRHIHHGAVRQGGVEGHALEVSMYAAQLAPYLERFPREDILLLRFEDLREDPLPVVRRACEFIGVDPGYEFRGVGRVHNANHARPKKTALLRALEGSGLAQASRFVLPAGARRAIADRLKKPAVNDIRLSRRQLLFYRRALKADLEALERTVGFDTSKWRLGEREGRREAKTRAAAGAAPKREP